MRASAAATTTTIVRPPDVELHGALRLAAVFAALVVLFHVWANLYEAHLGWGYFRDEFYYIACGRHLAWGYVDHGPVVALQARLAETVFGHSLAGLRMFSSLASGARMFLTGVLCWALGGRRAAQALAMIAVFVVPNYLGTDGYLSMNSFESPFWMLCLLALILIERGGSPKLWMLFGAAAGVGLLNKPSMTFFLLALLGALLVSPQRGLLASRWAAVGVGLLLLIALPNLLWQVHHGWPTLEFLRNGRMEHKNVSLAPLPFLVSQITELHPLNVLVWVPGLVWLLRRREFRWLGLTYVLFLLEMMALHAKNYYVTPIYPILFAAGGVAWGARLKRTASAGRLFAFPVLEGALIVTALIILPMSTPILTPARWIAYTRAMHLYGKSGNTENQELGPLPQYFADRFGWQEEADQVSRVFHSLTPAEQAQTVILCANYGEAGALNFLAPDLPTAISPHNSFWMWGPGTRPATILIDIEGTTPEHLRGFYSDVQIVGRMGTTYSMPFEHRNIYLLRNPKQTIQDLWPQKKMYI